ncbi:MAG: hypothetical protein DRQ88_03820 [Epsilonproteobacteria bacterium]|nr:MAG: hypothetical protein DRQ89_04125 [Campylobacterota bacterium]RLA67166.1 MAG: hypothetical protein DRQ88_03820 [Campylobacterota bacterium]
MFETLKSKLRKLHEILAQESKETKKMLDIYFRYSMGKASSTDIKFANNQFGDILKTAGLGVFLILPAAPITFPLILYIGKKLGIDVLPSSFKKDKVK